MWLSDLFLMIIKAPLEQYSVNECRPTKSFGY